MTSAKKRGGEISCSVSAAPAVLECQTPHSCFISSPLGYCSGLLPGLRALVLQSSWLLLAQEPRSMGSICSVVYQHQPWPLLWPLGFAGTSELMMTPRPSWPHDCHSFPNKPRMMKLQHGVEALELLWSCNVLEAGETQAWP